MSPQNAPRLPLLLGDMLAIAPWFGGAGQKTRKHDETNDGRGGSFSEGFNWLRLCMFAGPQVRRSHTNV